MSRTQPPSDPPTKDSKDHDTDPGIQATLREIKSILINLGRHLAVREKNRDRELDLWKAMAERQARIALPSIGELPALPEYDPEKTPAGGIHMNADMWKSFQGHIAEIKREKELEEAKTKAVSDALAVQEKKWERLRNRITWVLGVLTGLGALWGVLSHWFHWN